jgi:hypothetical protein
MNSVPRGLTITGLASMEWQSGDGRPLEQIKHAHDDWHANTVRFQVGVPLLRGKTKATSTWHGGGPVPALVEYLAVPGNGMTGSLKGNHYNVAFLAYLDQAVKLAQDLGMTVIISAQHETTDRTVMPEGNDIAFWKIIHDHYGADVVCDLFNEPVPDAIYADAWGGWQHGGKGSDGVTYTGLQALVRDLRAYGMTQAFWVEGIHFSNTLAGINGSAGSHRIQDPLNKIVYSVHHPRGPHNPANWRTQFGYLKAQGIPVVVGEWTNWAAKRSECWGDAPTAVPAFLDYVTSLGVGMTAWALIPNVLVVDQDAWVPTQIQPDSYACDGSVTGQGAGDLIRKRFAAWAGVPAG